MDSLKAFIINRLTVAADEIFGAVEKVMAECQEDADRTKEENARLRRLDSVSKPEIKRDLQSQGSEAKLSPSQQLCEQEGRISLGQENPETTLIIEEQEELWATQEEEQLPGLASDTEDFILTSPCVRTDFVQVLPQPTHHHLTQPVKNREMTPWDSQLNAAQIKTEPDRETYGGPGPTSDSLLLSVVIPDRTDGVESGALLQSVLKPFKPEIKRELQSHDCEEEVSPGQQLCEQEWRISLGQENPETTLGKEEQALLWATQQEEQLPGLASDTEDFILTSPCVRTDFDEFLPQPQIKTEPEGEGYGGAGPAGVSLLLSDRSDRVESSGLLQSVLNPLNPSRTERKERRIFPISTKEGNRNELWGLLPSHTGESSHRHMDFNTRGQHCESNVCKKSVNQKDDLLDHTKAHAWNGPYQYNMKHSLNRHMLMHTGNRLFQPFKCKECGKCFNMKHLLNSHMMTHIGAKPFKCKECGKCFNVKQYLNRHMMIHTGAKQFQCKECGKCFSLKQYLYRHMMIHTGAKSFKCEECGKRFLRKHDMNCHKRIHAAGSTLCTY